MAVNIQLVDDLESLLNYCSDKLDWQIDMNSFEEIEDVTYDFYANDIGLQESEFAKISSLRQLRPLVDNQPWGIFSIEFESKRFEVTALRKILSGLVPKRRNKDHEVWDKHDLLFLCFWGEDLNRTIGIAHFEDKESGLPQIKMISCAPRCEDFDKIRQFESNLSKLNWPTDTEDSQVWRKSWSKAFTVQYHQTIRESKELTDRLATIAKDIQSRILEILDVETPNGYVHLLFEKFKNTLIHDMTEEQFADMYAQTMVYGLFSARCMDSDANFDPKEAIDRIPNTNPFLKSLMKECFSQNDSKLSFDELQLNDIVDLLNHTDMKNILNDFNRQTGYGKEDPVIYFYEGFLNAYESEQKKRRGVYYTPQPVVKFIVSAVDDILKNEFGFSQGLADTATKTISVQRDSKRKIDGLIRKVEDTKEVSAIQILDPATGTGTFLRQTIIQIWDNFQAQNKGKSPEEIKKLWNKYVPEHLLRRLNGFELMMAPYAVAHMKLAMVLRETGYNFLGDERVKIFLTNSLEAPGNSSMQMIMENWKDPLATESIEANEVKKDQPINVVIGNPPYSISSSNKGNWIQFLLEDYKRNLNERKINLDDDYIKFIRFGQFVVEKSGEGILAYITNNSFINGITHRQMRKSLLETFDKIFIIDLHGNVMKQEKSPDGSKDENVFDIAQGVSICILIKTKHKDHRVYYYDLFGSRESKYSYLLRNDIATVDWITLEPVAPEFFFVPQNNAQKANYQSGFKVSELFNLYNSGIQTKCDALSVHFTRRELQVVLDDFKTKGITELKALYDEKSDSRDWTFATSKSDVKTSQYVITPYYYRPFDVRYTMFSGKTKGFIAYPRRETMSNIVGKDNISLCMMRQFFQDTTYNHIFVSNLPIDERTLYSNRGGTYIFPLYTYSEQIGIDSNKHYNFNVNEIQKIEKILKLRLSYNAGEGKFTGENLICYIYAVLYSNLYRQKYNQFLKYDFPCILYPTIQSAFWKLVTLGERLVRLHLPDSYYVVESSIEKPILILENYSYDISSNEVVLNKTLRIKSPCDFAWIYEIGGYKPAQKWLKDRVGKELAQEDLNVYSKILDAINETYKLSKEIDSALRRYKMI